MSFDAVGSRWNLSDPEAFREYVEQSVGQGMNWVRGVTLHHTAAPSLQMRPIGLTPQHVINIREYYKKPIRGVKKAWKSGPQLFVDDREVMGMTPLHEKGTHAVSFNGTHIGIEVLGDYDSEDPRTGRGLRAWKNTARATAIILKALDLPLSRFNFHRDDLQTDKTCPGRRVDRSWVQGLIRDAAKELASGEVVTAAVPFDQVASDTRFRLGPRIQTAREGGLVLAPIAETLQAFGVDHAYDSGNWAPIEIMHYDVETETSYGLLSAIVAVATAVPS